MCLQRPSLHAAVPEILQAHPQQRLLQQLAAAHPQQQPLRAATRLYVSHAVDPQVALDPQQFTYSIVMKITDNITESLLTYHIRWTGSDSSGSYADHFR